jgi:hypothetical protein
LQGDLERSLEKLNHLNDQNWLDYTETDINGKINLTKKFYEYKQQSVGLRETLERHYDKTIKDIKAGLPDVEVSEDSSDDEDYNFKDDGKGEWSCIECHVKNQGNTM